jgi:hypothetical protein
MTKPAKRRRARKAAKVRPKTPQDTGTESLEVPAEDLADREVVQDAWLLEREAEDIQRDGR